MKLKGGLSLDAALIDCQDNDFLQEKQKQSLQNSWKDEKSICPFISSTFIDLEEEFKHLHTDTFVKLKDFCNARGCRFVPVDNRRTAIDFRSTSEYVLKLGLDNVTKCLPYFICIIGNQYGPHKLPKTLPFPSDLHRSSSVTSSTSHSLSSIERNLFFAAHHGHPWVFDPLTQHCSMMELEILAACNMIDNDVPVNCYFYFKDYCQPYLEQMETDDTLPSVDKAEANQDMSTLLEAESDYAQNQLNQLKMQIINKGFPVKYFDSKEALGNAIFKDWSQIISSLYPLLSPKIAIGDELSTVNWSNQAFVASIRQDFYEYETLSDLKTKLYEHVQPILSFAMMEYFQFQENEMEIEEEVPLRGPKTGDGLFSTTASFIDSLKPPTIRKSTSDTRIFALVGDPGSGKTTLLSHWLEDFKKHNPEILVISEFVGSSHLSYDATAICRTCTRRLRERHWKSKKRTLGEEHLDEAKTFSGLVDTFASSLQLVPCVVLLDSVNDIKYGMDEEIRKIKGLAWLPKTIPPTCRFVLSTRRSDLSFKALQERGDVDFHWMPSVAVPTRERIFETLYQQNAADVLGRDLVEKVWTNRLSERPLFLATLSDLLRSCRNSRDVNQVIDKCTALRIFRDFWKSVFMLWSRRHSWSKHSTGQPGSVRLSSSAAGWVADALKLIATSRCGLSATEVLHILFLMGYKGRATVTPNDWDMFMQTAGRVLRTGHNGLITLAHDNVRLALEYCLLGAGRYSAALSSTHDSAQIRCHKLLASYFLKFTALDRKMVELPWHLRQAKEWQTLCEVLCKPRFFLTLCRASLHQSALYDDHVMYWRALIGHDHNILHYFKLMARAASEENANVSDPKELRRPSTTPRKGELRQISEVFAKPAAIIVTQHEESAASIVRSNEESRSETEERDFSDVESFSFFLTESEAEHQLPAGGWTPSEDDPESPIDSSLLEEDELADLYLRIAWFLLQLRGEFHAEGRKKLEDLRLHLEKARPLSSAQLLALFQLSHVECAHGVSVDPRRLRQALEIYDDLPVKVMNLDRVQKRSLLQGKGEISLALAETLIVDGCYEEAHQLVLDAFDIMQKLGNVCGQAMAETLFGKLLTSQGLYDEAEDVIRKALHVLIKWHGKMHLSSVKALSALSQVYSATYPSDGTNKRKAMLALKQALEVLEFNEKKVEGAHVISKIGRLLSAESSLRSKIEAQDCFDRALDAVITEKGLLDCESPAQAVNIDRKRIINDLQLGRYTHGPAKSSETRTPERPYSSLSWHHRDLDRLSVCTEVYGTTATARSEITPSAAKRSASVCTSRPYSPFSTRSIGNYVLVTPRCQSLRKVKSPSLYSWRGPPSSYPSVPPTTSRKDTDQNAVNHKLQEATGEPRPEGGARYVQSDKLDEGKEVPVIVVPAGRNSRLSVKLELDDWESRYHDADSVGDQLCLTEPSCRSERYSARQGITFRSLPPSPKRRSRNCQHQRRCQYRSGPQYLSTTVHGPHSLVKDVLPPPPSPRPSVTSSGIYHRSAWYHVPGRYSRPGENLPRKRNQVPPDSEVSFAVGLRTAPTSVRSSPTPRKPIENKSSAKGFPSVIRRQTVSQQSNRVSIEFPIQEESAAGESDAEEATSTTVRIIA